MRFVVCLVAFVRIASAEPTCVDAAACERACAQQPAACTHAAEMHFEGRAGFPLDHARSFRLAKRACDRKDVVGCAFLGLHYQDGVGTAYDPKRAVAVYERACKAGAGLACFNLSTMYSGAHGVALDPAKATHYRELARTHWDVACKGSAPRWCTNLAYVSGSDDKAAAIALHTRACDHGVLVGCVQAARGKLEAGQLDTVTYLNTLDKLCTRGEPGACGMIGGMLLLGENQIKKDGKRGIELLERSCSGGDRFSCFTLGLEYATGENTPKDFAATTRALDRACDRAFPAACVAIGQNLAANRAYKRAADYARRACHMGSGEGCGMLAQLYTDGSGVPKNELTSTKWAREGCRMGHLPSCGVLITRDVYPLPVAPDLQRRMYETACNERKLASACKRLGR